MFVEQLRQAVMAAPRIELPKVSALLWKAYAAGSITEEQASELSEAIEARKVIPAAGKPVQRRVGSRPSHPPAWRDAAPGPPPAICRRNSRHASRWARSRR